MTGGVGGQAAERSRQSITLKVRRQSVGILVQCDRENDSGSQEKERQGIDGASIEKGELKRAGVHGSVL